MCLRRSARYPPRTEAPLPAIHMLNFHLLLGVVRLLLFVARRSAACVFAKQGTLVAYVGGHKYNLRNWWSGRWSGR